ncbi:MAG: flagellar motor protein PomA [bacterium]
MDIATLIGFVGTIGVLLGAMIAGGGVAPFIDIPSIIVVVGGTITVVLSQVTLSQFIGSFKVAMGAFFHKGTEPEVLIEEAVELANIVRKEGILALEEKEISHPFLQKGINMCIDGQEPAVVQRSLANDINLTIEHQSVGITVFDASAEVAPAMGMIGTLIGLVLMLGNMDDPKTIGPSMAVALLTTLYGAVIANGIAMPISAKLKLRMNEEKLNKKLILESIEGIQEGTHPKVLEQLLINYLPESKRDAMLAAAD